MNTDRLYLAKTYFIRGWSLPAIINHLKLSRDEQEEVEEYLCDAYGRESVFPPERAQALLAQVA